MARPGRIPRLPPRAQRQGVLMNTVLDGSAAGVDLAVNADQSTVALSASSVEEGGQLVVTITARNAAGTPLSAKAITSLTVTPSGGISITGSGDTGGGGSALRTITAAIVGSGFTVVAVVEGVTITQQPTFDVEAPEPPAADGDGWDPEAFSTDAYSSDAYGGLV